MPNFIQKFKDFQSVTNSLNTLNSMVEEVFENLKSGCDPHEMTSELTLCAYLFRRDVINILDKYGENWNGEAKFIAPSISSSKITLIQAIAIVGGKISTAAGMIEINSFISNVMEGGQSYYSVERMIPNELKNIK